MYHNSVNELEEVCEDIISSVKRFVYIIYGCCMRFYSTVVQWTHLQRMKEDIIERVTSKVFGKPSFSKLIMSLYQITSKKQETVYVKRKLELVSLKPRDVGISPYLMLDKFGNLQKIF